MAETSASVIGVGHFVKHVVDAGAEGDEGGVIRQHVTVKTLSHVGGGVAADAGVDEEGGLVVGLFERLLDQERVGVTVGDGIAKDDKRRRGGLRGGGGSVRKPARMKMQRKRIVSFTAGT